MSSDHETERMRRPGALLLLATDQPLQHLSERSRAQLAKLPGVEELAVADGTRLVPHVAPFAIDHADHPRVAAGTIHALLLIVTRERARARRVERVDAFFGLHVRVLEGVEPESLARRAAVDLRVFDRDRVHWYMA